MGANCKLLLTVVGMAALLAGPSFDALGQTQFGGIATLKLSDPGGASEPWRIQHRLLRTFSTMQDCENQKENFIDLRVRRVEGHDLITANGASPVVEVESIECFTIREELYGQ
jgi:hypothetical protein